MSDAPRSLQSWVWTIQSVVLTADIFQSFIKFAGNGTRYDSSLEYLSSFDITIRLETVTMPSGMVSAKTSLSTKKSCSRRPKNGLLTALLPFLTRYGTSQWNAYSIVASLASNGTLPGRPSTPPPWPKTCNPCGAPGLCRAPNTLAVVQRGTRT